MTQCRAVLNIAGAHYQCDSDEPHDGIPHSNKEAQAIWDTAPPFGGTCGDTEPMSSLMTGICDLPKGHQGGHEGYYGNEYGARAVWGEEDEEPAPPSKGTGFMVTNPLGVLRPPSFNPFALEDDCDADD